MRLIQSLLQSLKRLKSEHLFDPFTCLYGLIKLIVQTGKTTAIRGIYVRETGISRHLGVQLRPP